MIPPAVPMAHGPVDKSKSVCVNASVCTRVIPCPLPFNAGLRHGRAGARGCPAAARALPRPPPRFTQRHGTARRHASRIGYACYARSPPRHWQMLRRGGAAPRHASGTLCRAQRCMLHAACSRSRLMRRDVMLLRRRGYLRPIGAQREVRPSRRAASSQDAARMAQRAEKHQDQERTGVYMFMISCRGWPQTVRDTTGLPLLTLLSPLSSVGSPPPPSSAGSAGSAVQPVYTLSHPSTPVRHTRHCVCVPPCRRSPLCASRRTWPSRAAWLRIGPGPASTSLPATSAPLCPRAGGTKPAAPRRRFSGALRSARASATLNGTRSVRGSASSASAASAASAAGKGHAGWLRAISSGAHR